jgi:hypothetical protein
MSKFGKRDAAKERFWRGIVGKHGGSGLSVRAYCRRLGLREHSFYCWRRELARRDGQAASRDREAKRASTLFVPVRVRGDDDVSAAKRGGGAALDGAAADADASCVDILLAVGRVVRVRAGFDPLMLREVVRALEDRPC